MDMWSSSKMETRWDICEYKLLLVLGARHGSTSLFGCALILDTSWASIDIPAVSSCGAQTRQMQQDVRSVPGINHFFFYLMCSCWHASSSAHVRGLARTLSGSNNVDDVVATGTFKQQLIKGPILASFDPGQPTQVHVEASHTVLGAVLTQVRSDTTRVVEYAS